MANFTYDKGVEKIMAGTIDLLADNLKFMLVDGASYTPSSTGDEFIDDGIGGGPVAGEVARSANLASKTIGSASARAFDCADATFASVAAGSPDELIVLFKDTGTDTTSPVIACWDTATGLPVTPNGNNINVTVNASGLFRL